METERAARSLSLKLQIVEARTPEAINQAFSAIVRQGTAALVVNPDVLFFRQRSQLVDLVARHRLPTIYEYRVIAVAGGSCLSDPTLMRFGGAVPSL
jgi:putative ABC transport system substrate-binding protein